MDQNVSNYFGRENYGHVMRVRKESDVGIWLKSIAHYELVAYINRTSTAIQGVRQLDTETFPISVTIRNLCGIFDRLLICLVASKSNSANGYRSWSRQMLRNIFNMLEKTLPEDKCVHVSELGQYLAGSFGNFTRVDYGIGHELSFVLFLCGLFRANILQPEDEIAAALVLFDRYLGFVRRLQIHFDLRPSNYQGAYSLDSYQFIAYMWGTAQLCYQPPFQPKKLLDAETIATWRREYMIAGCIGHVAKIKSGSFAMHSNQLWSLTALSSWTNIYRGLHNMYLKEIIGQLQVLGNLCFGQLLPFDPISPSSQLVLAELGYLSMARQQQLAKSWQQTLETSQQQYEPDKTLEESPEPVQSPSLLLLSKTDNSYRAMSDSVENLQLHSLAKRLGKLHELHAHLKANLWS